MLCANETEFWKVSFVSHSTYQISNRIESKIFDKLGNCLLLRCVVNKPACHQDVPATKMCTPQCVAVLLDFVKVENIRIIRIKKDNQTPDRTVCTDFPFGMCGGPEKDRHAWLLGW